MGEFRALWAAEVQSVAGDQLARVALSILVFERTGSAMLTALTYALTYLPDLLAGPLLAGLADRYPRRRVMVTCDVARAGLVGAMALPGVPLPLLAVLLLLVQLFLSPFGAAQFATINVALTDDQVDVAQATRLITHQAAQMAGFIVAAAVVATIGVRTALAIDAATFALSALLIRLGVQHRAAPTRQPDAPDSHLGRLAAGARLIWHSPILRTVVGLAWLAGFIIVPEGLAVPYTNQIGADAAAAGLVLAANPLGNVIGAIVITRMLSPARRQRLMGLFAIGAIAPLIPFAARPGLAIAVPLLMASGFCCAYMITALATFGRLVPDEQRAQAFGLAGSGLIAVQGIGIVGGGALAEGLNSSALAISMAGSIGVLVSLLMARSWRRHRDESGVAPAGSPGLTAPERPDRPEPGLAE